MRVVEVKQDGNQVFNIVGDEIEDKYNLMFHTMAFIWTGEISGCKVEAAVMVDYKGKLYIREEDFLISQT